jgi:hypothetical protein
LLNTARRYARDNLLSALIGPVAPPDDTAHVCPWEDSEDGMPSRCVFGPDRLITDEIELHTAAYQFADGSIDEGPSGGPAVFLGDRRIPLDRVPVMISALQDCLAEIERWKRTGGVTR